jgi:hypothetical protein
LLGFFIGTAELGTQAQKGVEDDSATDELIGMLRQVPDKQIIMFESPAKLYLVCRYAPDLTPRCFLLDFERGEINFAPDSRVFVRDLARKYGDFYQWPHAEKWATVKKLKHFYIVASFFVGGELNVFKPGPYPGFLVRRLGKDLYDLVPESGSTRPEPR